MRLDHREVPREYADRIALIEDYFKIDAAILNTLEKIQARPDQVTLKSIPLLHQQLFAFLNGIVNWMERSW